MDTDSAVALHWKVGFKKIKETPTQVFSYVYYEIFIVFMEHL